jgi:type II secretory pathway pseudopilin PulG
MRRPFSPLTRSPGVARRGWRVAGFTLAEVLASMLFMAIVIPVAMEGMSVASRAGILGQRKAAAMRIAERVLDEMIVMNELTSNAANGSIVDGDTSYPWTMKSEPWTEDPLTVVTVKVSFELQGSTFEVSASTLIDTGASTETETE